MFAVGSTLLPRLASQSRDACTDAGNAVTGHQIKACLVQRGPSVEFEFETNKRVSSEVAENKLP